MASAPIPRWRRWSRRVLVAAIALFLLGGALFATGWPQTRALIWSVRALTGAELEVDKLSLIGMVRADAIRLYAPGRPNDEPLVVVENLSVAYTAIPRGGRYIPYATADELHIRFHAGENGATNYDFLFSGEPRDQPVANTFLPKTIDVARMVASISLPGFETRLDGLGLEGAIEGVERFTVAVDSGSLSGHWNAEEYGGRGDIAQGFVEAGIQRNGDDFSVKTVVGIPGYAEADGFVRANLSDAGAVLDARFETLRIYGEYFEPIARRFIAVPLRFEVLDASGVRIRTAPADPWSSLPDAEANINVTGLTVGEQGEEWYDGPLILTGAFSGVDSHGRIEAVLKDGQQLNATFAGTPEDLQVSAEIPAWSRDETLAVLPGPLRDQLEPLAFEHFGSTLGLQWTDPAYTITGEAQLTGTELGEPIRAQLSGGGGGAGNPVFNGSLQAIAGTSLITATANAASAGDFTATVEARELPLGKWLGLILDDAPDVDATVSLEIAASRQNDGNVELTPEVILTALTFGEKEIDQVSIKANQAIYDVDAGDLSADAVSVEAASMASGEISQVRFQADQSTLTARAGVDLDLMELGAFLDLPDLFGMARAEGDLRYAGDTITAPVTIVTNDIAYGDLAIPYGSEAKAAFSLSFDPEANEGALNTLRVTLGEGTTLESPAFALTLDPATLSGPYSLTTDLKPAIDMYWLGSADGMATANGTVAYANESLSASFKAEARAERLTLPEEAAAVDGLSFTASGEYDGESINGTGNVSASAISAAGATLSAVSSPVRFESKHMVVSAISATVFDGAVTGSARVGLLEENFPIHAEAEVTAIDLERLTDEVQPPKVRLTGIANGAATVDYTTEGLADFTIDAQSNENFTLNRDIVRELLESPQFRTAFGAGQIERTIDKFLGDAPQRPFDSATLHLRLEEDRIRGEAVLLSEKTRDYNGLNLTVDLAVDPPALAEALKLLEKGDPENLATTVVEATSQQP